MFQLSWELKAIGSLVVSNRVGKSCIIELNFEFYLQCYHIMLFSLKGLGHAILGNI